MKQGIGLAEDSFSHSSDGLKPKNVTVCLLSIHSSQRQFNLKKGAENFSTIAVLRIHQISLKKLRNRSFVADLFSLVPLQSVLFVKQQDGV